MCVRREVFIHCVPVCEVCIQACVWERQVHCKKAGVCVRYAFTHVCVWREVCVSHNCKNNMCVRDRERYAFSLTLVIVSTMCVCEKERV